MAHNGVTKLQNNKHVKIFTRFLFKIVTSSQPIPTETAVQIYRTHQPLFSANQDGLLIRWYILFQTLHL